MTIKILPNERGVPQAKLADAELLFDEGVLQGLKLVGFTIWEGRDGHHITFPSRPFIVNNERRSYAVLRPISDSNAQEPLRQLILQAFVEFQHQAAALLARPLEPEEPRADNGDLLTPPPG